MIDWNFISWKSVKQSKGVTSPPKYRKILWMGNRTIYIIYFLMSVLRRSIWTDFPQHVCYVWNQYLFQEIIRETTPYGEFKGLNIIPKRRASNSTLSCADNRDYSDDLSSGCILIGTRTASVFISILSPLIRTRNWMYGLSTQKDSLAWIWIDNL